MKSARCKGRLCKKLLEIYKSTTKNRKRADRLNPKRLADLTASKLAEDKDGVIIRGYNLLNESIKHTVSLSGKTAVVANLLEEVTDAHVGLLGPADIQTLRFRPCGKINHGHDTL